MSSSFGLVIPFALSNSPFINFSFLVMGAQVLTEGDLAQGREKLFSVFKKKKKKG
jgi:hypothetical protein